jgi:hypothetical protein
LFDSFGEAVEAVVVVETPARWHVVNPAAVFCGFAASELDVAARLDADRPRAAPTGCRSESGEPSEDAET